MVCWWIDQPQVENPEKAGQASFNLPGLPKLGFLHCREEPSGGEELRIFARAQMSGFQSVAPGPAVAKAPGNPCKVCKFSDTPCLLSQKLVGAEGCSAVLFNRPSKWFSGLSLRTTCPGQ